MKISPDAIVYFKWGWFTVNATLVNSWIVMALLIMTSYLVTRNISYSMKNIPRFQHALEVIVGYIRSQIREITEQDPKIFLPFLGTLFLFISLSNLLALIPYFHPPTSSLTTTGALAFSVFLAVPFYGIKTLGLMKYLKQYVKPTVFLLPFKIISEITRTFALAVRLFGNIMSGSLVVMVLLSVAPLFLPILLQVLGLIIGQIQAYIFAVLAAIYIASGIKTLTKNSEKQGEKNHG